MSEFLMGVSYVSAIVCHIKKCRPVHRNLLWTLVGYHQLCSYPLCVFLRAGCYKVQIWLPRVVPPPPELQPQTFLFSFHKNILLCPVLPLRHEHTYTSFIQKSSLKALLSFYWPYLLKRMSLLNETTLHISRKG